MKAYIRRGSYYIEIDVKEKMIDASCYVRIEDIYGVIYETHLQNVLFVDGRSKHEG